MPRYIVKEKGFFNGMLYDPQGKRPFLYTDAPFPKGKDGKEKVPAWLERMEDESSEAAKGRKAAETKAAKAAAKKAEQDAKDIELASFMGEGESASTVETL